MTYRGFLHLHPNAGVQSDGGNKTYGNDCLDAAGAAG